MSILYYFFILSFYMRPRNLLQITCLIFSLTLASSSCREKHIKKFMFLLLFVFCINCFNKRSTNRKVMGLTPVGSTRKFLFPSMPVSLTEKTSYFTLITRLKIHHLHFHHCAEASHRHFNPTSMQDVCVV